MGRLPPLPLRPDDRPAQVLERSQAGRFAPEPDGLRSFPLHGHMAGDRYAGRGYRGTEACSADVSAVRRRRDRRQGANRRHDADYGRGRGGGVGPLRVENTRRRPASARHPHRSALLRLCHRRTSRTIRIFGPGPCFRLDPVSWFHVRLRRDRRFIISGEIFSVRQLDLAPHAGRTSASVIHICRCGDPVHHRSSADLSAQPHGRDHRCRDGFAHRRGVRADRRRDPTQHGLGSGAEEKSAGRSPGTRADKQANRPD